MLSTAAAVVSAHRQASGDNGYAHAKRFKHHHRQLRLPRRRLGRLIRDIRRSQIRPSSLLLPGNLLGERERPFEHGLQPARRKLYSLHAPEIECIGKGLRLPVAAPAQLAAWGAGSDDRGFDAGFVGRAGVAVL